MKVTAKVTDTNPVHSRLSVWVNGGLITAPGGICLRNEEVDPFVSRLANDPADLLPALQAVLHEAMRISAEVADNNRRLSEDKTTVGLVGHAALAAMHAAVSIRSALFAIDDATLLELAGADPGKEKDASRLKGPTLDGQDQPTSPAPASSSPPARFSAAPVGNGWRSVFIVDEHGCQLHTEPVCLVPVPWFIPFIEWLEKQPVPFATVPLLHHEQFSPPAQAAEPAERPLAVEDPRSGQLTCPVCTSELTCEVCHWQDVIAYRVNSSILDATRDLEEWADSAEWGGGPCQWPGGEPLGAFRAVIRKCAERIKARAKADMQEPVLDP